MKQTTYLLAVIAATLLLGSCKEKATSPVASEPGTIMISTRGVLVTMGLNGINQHDTIAFRIGRGSGSGTGTINITSFDWEILANHTGFLEPEDDIWEMTATGSGSSIHRITRSGDRARAFRWSLEYEYFTGGVPPKPYPKLTTTNTIGDSTSFIITTLGNGHFTIQPEGFPGWYLNAQHTYQPGPTTEFVEGKPQEFWFEPWE